MDSFSCVGGISELVSHAWLKILWFDQFSNKGFAETQSHEQNRICKNEK